MAKPVITDKPIIDQTEFNGVTIWRKEGGSIEISNTDYPSVKAALMDVANKASIEIDEGWNTQYLGWYLIRNINNNSSNIPLKENEIISEIALSNRYDLALDEQEMVVLSKENVAKVEAMIRNDSDYINAGSVDSLNNRKGSTAYWVMKLKQVLGRTCELSDREVIENLVCAIDRENSTHLNSDKVGIAQMTDRIMTVLHTNFVDLLKNPGKEYKMISLLSAPTIVPKEDTRHKQRQNYSFATKFCHYTSFYLFEGESEQDNFSIYDYVVKSALPYYAQKYDIAFKTKDVKVYPKYIGIIDDIIKASKSGISRNGFDHLLWYYFKGRMHLLDNTCQLSTKYIHGCRVLQEADH